jgi:asparagine synthase (glutamine-hydrolysing)
VIKRSPGNRSYKLAGLLAAHDPAATYLHCLSHWPDPAALVPGSSEPDTVLRSIRELKWLPSAEELAMLTDLTNYLPDDILTKVDRASMAVSLEARVPLLDHRVVEFAWKLPLRFKIRDGNKKWILKQVLYGYVPPKLLDQPKMGFGVPIDLWLRGPLRAWAEDLLSLQSLTRNGFFNAAPIRQRWEEHLSGKHNWDYPLWNVLIFQDWYSSSVSRGEAVSAYHHGGVI